MGQGHELRVSQATDGVYPTQHSVLYWHYRRSQQRRDRYTATDEHKDYQVQTILGGGEKSPS